MEQFAGKKERLMLGAGLAAALFLAAAQSFSPVAKVLMGGRDLHLALLSENSSVLLIYHPGSATVNALKLSQGRARRGISGYQRASDLSALAGAPVPGERGEIFYITLPSSAGMEALWSVLNSWKSVPVKFFEAAAWVFGLRSAGATNISPFGLFVLFSEFSRLNSSNFIVTEASRSGPEEAQPDGAAARPVVRVEVFNAAGQKDLAAATSKYLRAEGFDVLTAASYGKIEINTRILCFSGEPAAALKLRSALGLEGLEIHMRASKKSVAQAAVILGTDFNGAVLGKARPVKQ